MSGTYKFPSAEDAVDAQMTEQLRAAADKAASWDVIPRPETHSSFGKRVRVTQKTLEKLEWDLAKQQIGPPSNDPDRNARRAVLLELGASHRMFRSAIAAVSDKPRAIAGLPRIVGRQSGDEPRVAGVAGVYLQTVDGVFSAPTFTAFLQFLQAHEPLDVDEMWRIGAFLRFILLELILEEWRALLYSPGSVSLPVMMAHIKSLKSITHADWVFLIEPLIAFDSLLLQDPTGVYGRMDFDTRELYRRGVAQTARRSDCSEWDVAKAALELAQQAASRPNDGGRASSKRSHVGYYLIDKGFCDLAKRVGFHPAMAWRTRRYIRENADEFFVSAIFILTILFIAACLFPVVPRIDGLAALLVVVTLLFIPSSQDAVDLVNSTVTTMYDPEPLPKLNFTHGIPRDCTTLVAVPTLLMDEKQVRKLVSDLEVRFLANRDPNLHFVLLTDLGDSVSKPREKDSHPLVDLATRLIGELNVRYPSREDGVFLLLHRHRVFNTRQGVWMGWERKRGKLLDLNKLLLHEFDAFPIKAGPVGILDDVRYVLTLDSDSQLPGGTAARLVGAIAHPLNRAIIDLKLRIVTEGFGILQPRVGVAVRSTSGSRLAAIFSGQGGIDLYTRAISDAYQDLFGEGIYTGKGIYEVAALHAVLDRRFPRNWLLSHDLIEGAYARAGLATDVELIDDYPSHYNAYQRRKHRWVRGDWQIAPWMLSRVPDETGRMVQNPISGVSRWKIFDNLRRSLVDPAFFLLFLLGWTCLPGRPLYWTLVAIALMFFPAVAQFFFSLGRALASGGKGQASEALNGLGQASIVNLLRLALLPHDTLLAFDAIIRSLIRRFITGERLLEWETAAESEIQGGESAVDRYLGATPILALVVGALIFMFATPHWAIFCALPIIVLWSLAYPITAWLNSPPRKQLPLAPSGREYLAGQALRIWRFFYEFSSERHHYLIPDNVMEEGYREAARVSPTNVGLLLNARQSACELGFLTAPEFAMLTCRTLETVDRLEKYGGHLYNWYDTETLQPLDKSPFVSSVDSGNLAASLLTLISGSRALAKRPLLSQELFEGLRTHMRLLLTARRRPRDLSKLSLPDLSAPASEWIDWLPVARKVVAAAAESQRASQECGWLCHETLRRMDAIIDLIESYLPWLLPRFDCLRSVHQLGLDKCRFDLNCAGAIQFAEKVQFVIATAHRNLASDDQIGQACAQMLDLLPAAIRNLQTLLADLGKIDRQCDQLVREMDFEFLVDQGRQILSIGFDVAKYRRHDACYDLVASEARMATFLAIARGDIPYQSWLKLGRDHTCAYGRFLLLSWSGTMFEYLMPALWMRAYPGTMIARTQEACVQVQQAFGRSLGIPWGISESGASARNDRGDYHYFAYGIPRLSLWFEANAGPVVSPYSTYLSLVADSTQALKNLRRMESAGWTGRYGFYESADYSVSSRRPILVKEWMAHHLGMSLLAITNLLRNNVVQQWFHEHPMVRAAETLLQEAPVNTSVLKARLKEIAPIRGRTKKPSSPGAEFQKAAL